jgi:hypothetical protein
VKESVLSQLAALKGATAPVLKARWRELFDTEPPAYNRRFLESRLAYRIQELAYHAMSASAPGYTACCFSQSLLRSRTFIGLGRHAAVRILRPRAQRRQTCQIVRWQSAPPRQID